MIVYGLKKKPIVNFVGKKNETEECNIHKRYGI